MITPRLTRVLMSFVLLAPLSLSLGCQEEVAEVETPAGEVEVKENMDGTQEIEVDE